MSDNKKYYYIKLKENFFENDKIQYLQSLPEGYLFSDVLLKLLLKSLENNGVLMISSKIPYTPELIAKVTGHSLAVVQKAIHVMDQLEILEILDNGAIYMLDIQDLIGKSSTEADRKRIYRKRIEEDKKRLKEVSDKPKLPLGHLSGQVSDEHPPEIEIEIEKEIEIDNNKGNGTKSPSPDDDEIEKYLLEDLRITEQSTRNVLKALKDIKEGMDYLKEKVEYTESRTMGGCFKNVGFLIDAIRNNWKDTFKPKPKEENGKAPIIKTKFHNFEESSRRDYTDEELNSFVTNRKKKES